MISRPRWQNNAVRHNKMYVGWISEPRHSVGLYWEWNTIHDGSRGIKIHRLRILAIPCLEYCKQLKNKQNHISSRFPQGKDLRVYSRTCSRLVPCLLIRTPHRCWFDPHTWHLLLQADFSSARICEAPVVNSSCHRKCIFASRAIKWGYCCSSDHLENRRKTWNLQFIWLEYLSCIYHAYLGYYNTTIRSLLPILRNSGWDSISWVSYSIIRSRKTP